jgi:hypothetical protein
MMEYYYGTIGKNDVWSLLANKPIIVWSPEGEFKAFDAISDADKSYVSSDHQKAYFCQAGKWHEVNFLVEAATPKPALGFSPN